VIATLKLPTLWMTALDDPADRLELATLDQVPKSVDLPADVRAMESGRLRIFRRPGKKRSFTVNCTLATAAEADWIDAHVGVHLCFRGRFIRARMFGAYTTVSEEPYAMNDRWRISFTVLEVSHSEAV